MVIFRWIVGVVFVLLAVGALASFALFLAVDIPVWLKRARRFRHWLWLTTLVWFNVEVWGRVVRVIIHWV